MFPREVLAEATLEAGRQLLGARLVRDQAGGVRVGRIVEVEAYVGPEDLASHARFGRTNRNAVMFGPPGRAYVYLVYGMYECLNVVTEEEGRPAALLVRAVEPMEGAALMRDARLRWASRRSGSSARTEERLRDLPEERLASGPGLVGVAFGIGRVDSGSDLCVAGATLRLERPEAGERAPHVVTTARIGIDYAPAPWRDQAWRLVDAGSPSVSVRPSGLTRRPAGGAS